jgi:IS4 transposase
LLRSDVSCTISCIATKTISLELDAYEKLRKAKRAGESFSAVVRRARFGPADTTGRSILESLSSRTPSEEDRRAVEYWDDGVAHARTISSSSWEQPET